MKQGSYQVDFQSLIRVLGENLYSNPKAAVRELIQNANDSIVRRGANSRFSPEIRLHADRDERTLIISDNGAGMVEEEVVRYLASVGGGGTRNVRERLKTSDPDAAQMLIGQFGIGFLSAFVVAERVVVETCSLNGRLPVRWECEGTAEYQIGMGNNHDPGTKVTLFLKKAHLDLLDESVLKKAIIKYADLISYPIYLNNARQPVNRMNAPWHLDGTEIEYGTYIEHRYNVAPLALYPVQENSDDLRISGVLFIPPRSSKFTRRLRSADVFQKRMFVGEDLDILPEWAGFVCAVFDCPTLQLMANREGALNETASYKALKKFLRKSVSGFIEQLATSDRQTFTKVLQQYDWQVLSGAIRNDSFFEHIKDLIPVPTDMGTITMPTYLQRVRPRLGDLRTIYYIPGEQPLGQQQSSLFKSQGIPIIHADIVVEKFLEKYAEKTTNVALRPIASGIVELMVFADGNQWRRLESQFQEIGIVAKAVEFDPPELTGMAIRQDDYDQSRLIEQVISGHRSLFDFMGRVGRETSDAYGLAFNVTSPIVQNLADYNGDEKVLHTILQSLFASALLSAGVELTIELSQRIAKAQSDTISLLLSQAETISHIEQK